MICEEGDGRKAASGPSVSPHLESRPRFATRQAAEPARNCVFEAHDEPEEGMSPRHTRWRWIWTKRRNRAELGQPGALENSCIVRSMNDANQTIVSRASRDTVSARRPSTAGVPLPRRNTRRWAAPAAFRYPALTQLVTSPRHSLTFTIAMIRVAFLVTSSPVSQATRHAARAWQCQPRVFLLRTPVTCAAPGLTRMSKSRHVACRLTQASADSPPFATPTRLCAAGSRPARRARRHHHRQSGGARTILVSAR